MSITLIRGIPGSGKSTLAKSMIDDGTADRHYEADMWFDRFNNGEFDHRKLRMAHEWCQKMTEVDHRAGMRVVVANTFTRLWEMDAYYDIDPALSVIICDGKYRNVHGVPDSKVNEMRARFEFARVTHRRPHLPAAGVSASHAGPSCGVAGAEDFR